MEGHDRATWDAATFCYKGDYLGIDTIDLSFTVEPDNPNKYKYDSGDIYFHVPDGRVETEIAGIYDRRYCQLIKEIN